jgi:hypothetical protein
MCLYVLRRGYKSLLDRRRWRAMMAEDVSGYHLQVSPTTLLPKDVGIF